MTPNPATILIVDDDPQNCKLLEALLHHEGYLTVCAFSGAQALRQVAECAPDLILLDVMMPEMDGYEVAATLKADPVSASIPIIMVTALADRDARLAGLKAGAEEFLSKPIDRAELWLRVRNLLRLKDYGDFLSNHTRILEDQVRARTADLQRFRAAMDATADGIFLTSRSTMQFVEVNATACNMLGYTREELLATGPQSLTDYTTEQLADIFDDLIAARVTNALTETMMRRKDGSWLKVDRNRVALRSGNDWIVVTVMRDITERQQAQEEILRLNTSLEERVQQRTAQLLEANQELEAFSYSASHDLRTPLSAIAGFSSLLARNLGESATSERDKHYLGRIGAGVAKMGEQIDALLSLAQLSRTTLRWETVDLSAIATTLLEAYKNHEPGRITQIDIQPDLLVQGDPDLLRNVMDYLLCNAWKFSEPQPQTHITFRRESGPDGGAVYAVQDKGVGFDMAHSGKLFGAFQRMHSVGEFIGSGVDLAKARRIVMRHGGRVWAESAPGQGATFYFTLGRPRD